jgi:hypothetical protein
MTYVAVRRVERAKLMMASTGQRLTDIASACGFADQSHLNRYFRRIVGVSPGLWRREWLTGPMAADLPVIYGERTRSFLTAASQAAVKRANDESNGRSTASLRS